MVARTSTSPIHLCAYGWRDKGKGFASTEGDAMHAGEYLITSKMLRHR